MGAILGRGVVKKAEEEEKKEGRFGKSLFHREAEQDGLTNDAARRANLGRG